MECLIGQALPCDLLVPNSVGSATQATAGCTDICLRVVPQRYRGHSSSSLAFEDRLPSKVELAAEAKSNGRRRSFSTLNH